MLLSCASERNTPCFPLPRAFVHFKKPSDLGQMMTTFEIQKANKYDIEKHVLSYLSITKARQCKDLKPMKHCLFLDL